MPDFQAKWETELRKKLAAIRDEAMELAAAIEFTGDTNPQDNPIHIFAVYVIECAEGLMRNADGELDYPGKVRQ